MLATIAVIAAMKTEAPASELAKMTGANNEKERK